MFGASGLGHTSAYIEQSLVIFFASFDVEILIL